MTERDFNNFADSLIALGEVYDKALTPATIQIYFAALADLDYRIIAQAFGAAASQLRWFPKPIEIRELIMGTAADQGQQAWESFLTAVKRFGGYTSVKFEDPAIPDAILATFGGWIEACTKLPESQDPMYANFRKNFAAAYELARKKLEHRAQYLPGIAEAQNRTSGLIGQEFAQIVGLIGQGGECREVRATFDTQGRLTEGARAQMGLPAAPEADNGGQIGAIVRQLIREVA